jgi:hypothetical protein
MPQTIYCDESGFTGPHLFDKQQPFFVYSSVAISPDLADDVVAKARKDFGLHSDEIKGSKLIKSARGRKVLSFFLQECACVSQSIFAEKEYALAGKLFEYIFEPALSENSSLFYRLGFHKFVSSLLFAELRTRSASAEQLLIAFERLMRTPSTDGSASLLHEHAPRNPARSIAAEILEFAQAQRESILRERTDIERLGPVGVWTLDLTGTSLAALLCHWALQFDRLDVSCDESKPLRALLAEKDNPFAMMVGRADKQYVDIGRGKRLVTFNLARPIDLVSSKQSTGVQIADAIATSVGYALKNPRDKLANAWRHTFEDFHMIHEDSITANLADADVKNRPALINAALFIELLRRCREGMPLLDGLEDFVHFLHLSI